MRIEYHADQGVSEVIASMGRTEDVKFSPSGRRLGVAEFKNNRIVLFELDHEEVAQQRISLTRSLYLSSPAIDHPHGIEFIDEETILVANRDGDVCVFKVASIGSNSNNAELVKVISSDETTLINTPGSVAVLRGESKGEFEALICNNYVHYVTRHVIDPSHEYAVKRSEVLLKEWLCVPDGISVSDDARWIAVSNHEMHAVLVYENSAELNERSDPVAILRSMRFPHGLRFAADGRFILLADAGAPYVHVYGCQGASWSGVHDPILSLKVMNDDRFLSCRYTIRDGGPKGLDIDSRHGVLVTSCHSQPLAFYDLKSVLQKATSADVTAQSETASCHAEVPTYPERRSSVRHELELHRKLFEAEARAERAEKMASRAKARYDTLQRSSLWRLTAPFRAVGSAIKKGGYLRSAWARR